MTERPHGEVLDEMDHQAKYQSATVDTRREEQLRIQALGSAVSRRDWHAVERAYEAIRDKFDRPSGTTQANYVVRKGGYFYRPDAQGYTLSIHEAGRWTKAEAEKYTAAEGVSAHPFSQFIKPLGSPSEATPADVLAMKEACKRAVTEMRDKYGSPTGDPYCNGLWDQSQRILAAIDKLSPEVKAEGGRDEPVACVFCRHLISDDDKAVVDCNGEIACAACGESEFRAQEQER